MCGKAGGLAETRLWEIRSWLLNYLRLRVGKSTDRWSLGRCSSSADNGSMSATSGSGAVVIRSKFNWRFIQNSAVVPSALDSRRAVSRVMAVWPFSSRSMRVRGTWIWLASCPTLIPISSRNSRFKISPGWVGAFDLVMLVLSICQQPLERHLVAVLTPNSRFRINH